MGKLEISVRLPSNFEGFKSKNHKFTGRLENFLSNLAEFLSRLHASFESTDLGLARQVSNVKTPLLSPR
jgi:hypothetical protein